MVVVDLDIRMATETGWGPKSCYSVRDYFTGVKTLQVKRLKRCLCCASGCRWSKVFVISCPDKLFLGFKIAALVYRGSGTRSKSNTIQSFPWLLGLEQSIVNAEVVPAMHMFAYLCYTPWEQV